MSQDLWLWSDALHQCYQALTLSLTHNTSHKFWDQFPCLHDQCCLQVSETVSCHKLRCCYSANMLQHWVRGRGLIFFCKVDHFRISINFSRNWLDFNDLCEILQVEVVQLNILKGYLNNLKLTNFQQVRSKM